MLSLLAFEIAIFCKKGCDDDDDDNDDYGKNEYAR